MRTRRLLGTLLLVLALHALGWRLAVGGSASSGPARAGVRVVALVSVPQGRGVPRDAGDAPPARDARGAARRALVTPAAPAAPAAPVTRIARGARRRGAGAGVLAGQGGASPPSRTRAPPDRWPVYATRPPPSMSLRYVVAQHLGPAASAPASGEATLAWVNTGGAFALTLSTTVADRPPREWASAGRFDAAGVAPQSLVERERGRDRRAVQFDREAAQVHFSSAPEVPGTAPGVQDRWSWIAQLAAIAEAESLRGPPVGPWTLQVAGLRGDLARWTFRVVPPADPPSLIAPSGNELSAAAERAPGLLHVLRASERPYDLRIEAWLSPALHHFPTALRMSTPPGPWSLTLARPST